jgi:hypothetical protein
MAGAPTIVKDATPLQRVYEKTYGPFAEATMVDQILDVFTRNTIIEAVEVVGGTESSDEASFNLTGITSGQSHADAITATQHVLADAVDLTEAADGVFLAPEVADEWNVISTGGRLGLNATGTATDLAGLFIKVRFSEYVAR